MKDEKKKDLTAMFMELKDRVRGRLEFVKTSGVPENEINIKVYENEIFLKIIDKIIDHKIKPIESIETVTGEQYKIGDKFCIKGNSMSTYKIHYFPDSCTVRGVCSNPAIGDAWTVEAYIENIYKPKKEKAEKPVRIKKEEPIEIKVGDYFSVKTNNTVYKANRVKQTQVFGVNELKKNNFIGALRTDIVIKTKKDYKKQHKSERKNKK